MTQAWLLIAITLLAHGAAGLTGGLLSERWLVRHQSALVGFAAGAMLAAVFADVLPESLHAFGPEALNWTFGGFIAMALIEWLVGHHHHKEEGAPQRALPASLLMSDALHNLADGAAVAAAFLASPGVGAAVALATIAHEVPQEVGDYAVLRASGLSRSRALLALAAVQLTSVAGALGIVLLAGHTREVTAIVLSIAAGTFLYIAATDLLPEIHAGRTAGERRKRMLGFLAGVALILLVSAVLPHDAEH